MHAGVDIAADAGAGVQCSRVRCQCMGGGSVKCLHIMPKCRCPRWSHRPALEPRIPDGSCMIRGGSPSALELCVAAICCYATYPTDPALPLALILLATYLCHPQPLPLDRRIETDILSVAGLDAAELGEGCPLNPSADLFLHQERHKHPAKSGNLKCGFCVRSPLPL